MSGSKRKAILALLIGPLAVVPAMLVLVLVTLRFQADLSVTPDQLLGGSFIVAVVGIGFAYVFTLLYGAPVYWLLSRRGPVKSAHILLVSLFPTLIVGGLLSQSWLFAAFMAYFSVVVCYTTWFLASRAPTSQLDPPRPEE